MFDELTKYAPENKAFVADIEAHAGKKFEIPQTDEDKETMSILYFGWLMGKYGSNWEDNVKPLNLNIPELFINNVSGSLYQCASCQFSMCSKCAYLQEDYKEKFL